MTIFVEEVLLGSQTPKQGDGLVDTYRLNQSGSQVTALLQQLLQASIWSDEKPRVHRATTERIMSTPVTPTEQEALVGLMILSNRMTPLSVGEKRSRPPDITYDMGVASCPKSPCGPPRPKMPLSGSTGSFDRLPRPFVSQMAPHVVRNLPSAAPCNGRLPAPFLQPTRLPPTDYQQRYLVPQPGALAAAPATSGLKAEVAAPSLIKLPTPFIKLPTPFPSAVLAPFPSAVLAPFQPRPPPQPSAVQGWH